MPHGSRGYRTGGGAAEAPPGDGTINFRKDHDVALAAVTVADFGPVAASDLALGDVAVVADLLSTTGTSLSVEQQISGTVVPSAEAALSSTVVADMTNLRQTSAAASITQLTIDYSRTPGAASVVETQVGGRTDWTNDASATGLPDGSNATIAGNLLGARGGQLEFSYADFTDKDMLDVSSVVLRFYVSQSGTLLANGSLQLKWRKVSTDSWTVLETITGNVASLSTPRVFDVTSSYTAPVPSDLNGIETAVSFSAAVAQTYTAACDAVTLSVAASTVEAL